MASRFFENSLQMLHPLCLCNGFTQDKMPARLHTITSIKTKMIIHLLAAAALMPTEIAVWLASLKRYSNSFSAAARIQDDVTCVTVKYNAIE
jgi:hypothetical protein